jgi:hypothetical protein
MKRPLTAIVLFLAVFMITGVLGAAGTNEMTGKAAQWPFFVYTEAFSRLNHFVASGWMGDINDLRFSDKWITGPKNGKTCIRIDYSAKRSQGAGWAGIYWQDPALNWGNMKGGYDLTGANTISFWARAEKDGDVAEFKVGGIKGEYRDSSSASTGQISLTTNWRRYGIDLSSYDMNTVIGGFCVVFDKQQDMSGCVIYIDDIEFDTNSIKSVRDSNNPGNTNK